MMKSWLKVKDYSNKEKRKLGKKEKNLPKSLKVRQ